MFLVAMKVSRNDSKSHLKSNMIKLKFNCSVGKYFFSIQVKGQVHKLSSKLSSLSCNKVSPFSSLKWREKYSFRQIRTLKSFNLDKHQVISLRRLLDLELNKQKMIMIDFILHPFFLNRHAKDKSHFLTEN